MNVIRVLRLYKVRAIGASGSSDFTGINVATTIMYVDTALSGVTVKAEDVLRLRAAVSLAGVMIKKIHLTELRAALDPALPILGLAPVSYTDSVIAQGGTPVRAAHWLEIREATQ